LIFVFYLFACALARKGFTMKISSLVVLSAICFLAAGCAGTTNVKQTAVGGLQVTQFERTGIFGTDNSGAYIRELPKPPASPEVVKLERTYKKSVTSWSGCPDKTPNRNAKHVQRHEQEEAWSDEVLVNNNQSSSQPVVVGGSNASTGNFAIPALIGAGGQVGAAAALRPDSTKINTSGGNIKTNVDVSAEGGKGGDSNSEINHSGNSDSNSEINHSGNSESYSEGGKAYGGDAKAYGGDSTAYGGDAKAYGGQGGAGGSSSSSSSAAAAAAAAAAASGGGNGCNNGHCR
jgi:hypothetical protein